MEGDGLTTAADVVPEPLSEAVWGLPTALSVTVNAALLGPVAVGVNVTVILQDPPAATDVPHPFV